MRICHVLGLLLLAPNLARAEVVERVAAVVNNEVIALSEIYEVGGDFIAEALSSDASKENRRTAELKVLDELVAQELMVQEMARLAIDVTSVEVDQALDDIASRNSVDRTRLKQEVERSGLNWASYREGITQELRTMKFDQVVLQPRVSLSEDEVEALYRKKVAELEPSRVLEGVFLPWSSEVSLETPGPFLDRLSKAKADLNAGKTWLEVVQAFPESPYASRAGQMSTYQRGELVDVLESAAWALGVGEISDPVVTEGGVFMLRYAAEAPAAVPPMSGIINQLQGELMMQKIEQERTLWLAQARRKASVEVKLQAP